MHRTLDEIRREGLDALRERLGRAGLVRFLQQFETGSGDYTNRKTGQARLLTCPSCSAETAEELAQRRMCVARGKPFRNPTSTQRTIARLGLESSTRLRGQPRKRPHHKA